MLFLYGITAVLLLVCSFRFLKNLFFYLTVYEVESVVRHGISLLNVCESENCYLIEILVAKSKLSVSYCNLCIEGFSMQRLYQKFGIPWSTIKTALEDRRIFL